MVKLLGGDAARALLVEQAAIRPGQRVLDVGCGTGSLLVQLKRRYADVEAVGLDPDPRALARARRKGLRAGFSFQLDQGFADELPYADASFDRVVSSFMFRKPAPFGFLVLASQSLAAARLAVLHMVLQLRVFPPVSALLLALSNAKM